MEITALAERAIDADAADDGAVEEAHRAGTQIGLETQGRVLIRYRQADAAVLLPSNRSIDASIECVQLIGTRVGGEQTLKLSHLSIAETTEACLGRIAQATGIERHWRNAQGNSVIAHRQADFQWRFDIGNFTQTRLAVVAANGHALGDSRAALLLDLIEGALHRLARLGLRIDRPGRVHAMVVVKTAACRLCGISASTRYQGIGGAQTRRRDRLLGCRSNLYLGRFRNLRQAGLGQTRLTSLTALADEGVGGNRSGKRVGVGLGRCLQGQGASIQIGGLGILALGTVNAGGTGEDLRVVRRQIHRLVGRLFSATVITGLAQGLGHADLQLWIIGSLVEQWLI